MQVLNIRGGLSVVAALVLTAIVAGPAGAAATSRPSAGAVEADHVDLADCDVISLDGGLRVNGVALTQQQIDAMQLTDAALVLAAEATGPDAEACIDVAGLPGTPVVNGHIRVCGPVVADPDVGQSLDAVIMIGDVPIRDGMSTVDTNEALQVADAADVEACFAVDVIDTGTYAEVVPEPVCAGTTLRSDGTLELVIGDMEMSLGQVSATDLTILDAGGRLSLDEEVLVQLALVATEDRVAHSGEFVITVSACTAEPEVPNTAMAEPSGSAPALALVLIGFAWIGGAALRVRSARSGS